MQVLNVAEASQPSFTLVSVLVEHLPLPAPPASFQIANVGFIISFGSDSCFFFYFFQREALKNYKQQEAICLGGGVWVFFFFLKLSLAMYEVHFH